MLFSFVQCFRVSIREAYSFLTMNGYGIFNVRTNFGARRTHKGGGGKRGEEGGEGGGSGVCIQVCARVDSGGQKKTRSLLTQPRHNRGIEHRVFGLEFRRSNQ